MITLIRHSTSTFNENGDLTKDCPLTQSGKNLAKNLKGEYDLVVCSSLKRARQTLDESNLIYKNVIFTDLCRELRDGTPINLFKGESDDMLEESEESINKRLTEFKNLLKDYAKKYSSIAVISHFGFLYGLTKKHFKNCHCMKIDLNNLN